VDEVGPDAGAGANLMPLLRSRRVLRVGSTRAGSVARIPRRPLVMGRLNDAVDRTLLRIHVIQSVVGADRVGVCRCPGAVARTGKSNARSARRTLYLTSESHTGTQAQDEGGYRDRSSESCDESARHRQVPPSAEVGLAIGFRHESGDRSWGRRTVELPRGSRHLSRGAHHAPAEVYAEGVPRNVVSRCTDPPTQALSLGASTTTCGIDQVRTWSYSAAFLHGHPTCVRCSR